MNRIKEIIKKIKEPDKEFIKKAQFHLDNLTKPIGSLGKLEDLAKRIVYITGSENPSIKEKTIFVLASDHGVVEEKVSAYPQEVTLQMVYNFLSGGAGINVLARHIGAKVIVVDIGVKGKIKSKKLNFKDKKINFGTKNIAKGPAMTIEEAIRSIETGIELVEEEAKKGVDIIGVGEMGIGNTTPSSAIAAAITGKKVEEVTGYGTGIKKEMLKNKIEVIKKSLIINKPDKNDGIDILSKIGGFEIGGIAGIIIGCASLKIPIVIDGFITGAGALIAYKIEPKILNYLIPSHCSAEPGHKIILEYLGLEPLLNLNMRLGEGTGAALAINLIEASVKIFNEMATFKEAGVSEATEK